jgi:hypothetical protein
LVHSTQVLAGPQCGAVAATAVQSLLLRQPTQICAEVSQCGVGVVQAWSPVQGVTQALSWQFMPVPHCAAAVHCTHWLSFEQWVALAPVQWLSSVQATHWFLALQCGVCVGHWLSLTQATHSWLPVLQWVLLELGRQLASLTQPVTQAKAPLQIAVVPEQSLLLKHCTHPSVTGLQNLVGAEHSESPVQPTQPPGGLLQCGAPGPQVASPLQGVRHWPEPASHSGVAPVHW